MRPPPDARAVHVATALFRACARLLPARLRSGHGGELEADFRHLAREVHTRAGLSGLATTTARACADVVLRSPREYWSERRDEPPAIRVGRRRPGPRRRRMGGLERMRIWWNELRVAARTLAARPGFTLVGVITLALGIGANVAIFAVVNAVLIRPLAYPDSERIVVLNHHAPGLELEQLQNSHGSIHLYQTSARALAAVAAVDDEARNLTGLDRPERVRVVQVSPEFFEVFGTRPFMGRPFTSDDAVPGPKRVTVLTHSGWSTHFGRDPDILGRVVGMDGTPAEIIGVMPRGFAYPDPETVALLPMWVDPNGGYSTFGIGALARLAPGVALGDAEREVAALQARVPEISTLTPEFLERARWRASVTPLRDVVVGDVEAALWIVLATVSLVLLIACANVANLFLVRAEARQREVAIRAALGASRGRLAGGFLSESLLMGLAGGVAGMALAAVGVRALVAAGPPQLPRLHEVGIDGATLLFAAAVTLLAGLLFGALPLPRYLAGRRFAATLREGRADTGSRQRHRTRKALIVAQVALALVLLTGSGLMLRSFQRLSSVEAGIRPDGVLTVGVSLGGYESPEEAGGFYRRVVEEVRTVPGVRAAGAANSLPIQLSGINGSSFHIESRPRTDEDELPPLAMYAAVTDGVFEALGIPVVRGRTMEPRDLEPPGQAVWVNETFARRFLDGEALGERVRFGTDSAWLTVAGVVGDVRWFGLKEEVRPMAFLPMSTGVSGVGLSLVQLAVRSDGAPMAVLPGVRAAVARVASEVPLTTARTMREIVDGSMAETSFTMTVLTIAALVALL
ncbi:MAG TPA: ADOP family duplicated permease, partial [Longimicrobiales bacterium]|nr:ADOP family duplicated permease [Longimicrobiales bacterium]